MAVDFSVPFYPNTPDNTHCFQAALKMVLKYFLPKKDFSWHQLEKITAKVDGFGTWPLAGMLWMDKNGFDVVDIETFDYEKFIKNGGQYLIELNGEDIGQRQIKQSYIPQEIEFSKKLLKRGITKKTLPSQETIVEFLQKRYLVICNINMQALNNKPGYIGHFVVVKGYNDKGFVLHDPGLPPQENRLVSYGDFAKAWTDPNEEARNVMALKFTG